VAVEFESQRDLVYDARVEGLAMRIAVRLLGLWACSVAAACSAVGTMGETDGDTDTDTDTDSVGSTVTLSTMSTQTTTDGAPTMTGGSTMTSPVTTDEPTTGTTMDPGTTEDTGCTPGAEGCPCDVGSTCEGDLQCVDGTCVGRAACDQPDEEPNDSFEEAIDLGSIMCSMEYEMVEGALDGTDADFYALAYADGGFCVFEPNPEALVTADQDVRVCVYIDCGEDGTNVTCGDQEADTFDDLDGCCDTNEANVGGGCEGVVFPPEPSGYFIRVISAEEDACIPYELSYRFQ
jgi:hypothetical protein